MEHLLQCQALSPFRSWLLTLIGRNPPGAFLTLPLQFLLNQGCIWFNGRKLFDHPMLPMTKAVYHLGQCHLCCLAQICQVGSASRFPSSANTVPLRKCRVP